VLASLYFRALVSISSFSKSLRRDLKIFLDGWPVLSTISWRVNSLPSVFRVFMTSLSVLFSFTMAWAFPFVVCVLWFARVFQFCGKPMRKETVSGLW
jgi:hypothetical protein